MALNSPLGQNGVPFRLNDEYILLERPGMDIEIKMEGRSTISGKGRVYLTTSRMVFVSEKYLTDKFKSFDMPIAFLIKPKFEQPVFGANYLQFTVKPLSHTLPFDAHVKLWFSKGGCERFLKIYEHVSKQVYEQKKTQRMNNTLYNNWATGFFTNNNAFVDPSDPTVIITEQPPVFNPSQQFIGENIYVNPNTNYPDLGDNVPAQRQQQPQQGGMYPQAPPQQQPQQNQYHPQFQQAPQQQGYQSPQGQYGQPSFGQPPQNYPQQQQHQYYGQPNLGQPPSNTIQPNFGQPPANYGAPNLGQPPTNTMQPNFGQPPINYGAPNLGQPPTNYGQPQPQNNFAQNPAYQNVPNINNPVQAVNQAQAPNNGGYYFGFWGPQLQQGNQGR